MIGLIHPLDWYTIDLTLVFQNPKHLPCEWLFGPLFEGIQKGGVCGSKHLPLPLLTTSPLSLPDIPPPWESSAQKKKRELARVLKEKNNKCNEHV